MQAGEHFQDDEQILFASALDESDYLCGIHQGLACHPQIDELRNALGFVVGGAYHRIDDADTAKARNKAFELSIAARLFRGGLEVDLSDVADIVALYDQQQFVIECKRPTNEQALRGNYEKANRQLRKRFEKRPHAVGIVAICATAAKNPGGGFLRTATPMVLQAAMNNLTAMVNAELSRTIQRMSGEDRIPRQNNGIMIELTAFAEVGDPPVPYSAIDILIAPTWDADDPIRVFSEALGARRTPFP